MKSGREKIIEPKVRISSRSASEPVKLSNPGTASESEAESTPEKLSGQTARKRTKPFQG